MRRFTAGAAVVAVLALAGGATAAGRWVITSMHQIKPSVRAQLRGDVGPQGPQGPQGAPGPAGVASIENASASAPICGFGSGSCDVALATASCPSGSYVVGGSANVDTIETPISTFAGATSYAAVADNSSSFSGTLMVTAICASGGGLQHLVRSGSASSAANGLAARLRMEQR
jgi:hypothetical protein